MILNSIEFPDPQLQDEIEVRTSDISVPNQYQNLIQVASVFVFRQKMLTLRVGPLTETEKNSFLALYVANKGVAIPMTILEYEGNGILLEIESVTERDICSYNISFRVITACLS